MPYPNEHSARLQDPGKFDPKAYKRTNGGKLYGKLVVPATIAIIWGKLTGKNKPSDPPIAQALRFPIKAWTVEKAKAWLKTNKVKYIKFEPAGKAKEDEDIDIETVGYDLLLESYEEIIDDATDDPTGKGELIEDVITRAFEIEEAEDGSVFLSSIFVEGDVKNANRNLYPSKLVSKIVKQVNEKITLGMDGHPGFLSGGSYRDIALRYTHAWKSKADGHVKIKVLDTAAGKDLKVIAREGIPIGLSMRGYGDRKHDEDKDTYIVQNNYELATIDAVLEPACEKAWAIREQREQQHKEDNVEELEKMIKALTESVKGMNTDITALKETVAKGVEGTKLSEDTIKLLGELQTRLDAEKNLLAAQKQVKAYVDDVEAMKPILEFKNVLLKQLESCESIAQVEATYPRVMDTLLEMKGKLPAVIEPVHIVELKDPSKLFGGARPKTVQEAFQRIIDEYPDTGDHITDNRLDNPRYHAKILIENYIKFYMSGRQENRMDNIPGNDIFRNVRSNPLFWLTEAVGDAEMDTGDVAATAGYMLPLYTIVMKDAINLMNQCVAIQALTVPTAKAFFGKEYYGDGAAGWTEIAATFSETQGDKAEGAAPQILKFMIESEVIDLKTAKKYMAPFTREVEQDIRAYHGINLESINIQMLRRAVMRGNSHGVLTSLKDDTAFVKSDGLKEAVGSPLEYVEACPPGYTQGDWDKTGMGKTVLQASSLINIDPYDVEADIIVCHTSNSHLFMDHHFVSEGAIITNFGFNRVGTFQEKFKVFTTTKATYKDKVAVFHRGSSFIDAAMLFMPYILFFIDDLVVATNLQASRSVMSRVTWAKVFGGKIAFIDITPM